MKPVIIFAAIIINILLMTVGYVTGHKNGEIEASKEFSDYQIYCSPDSFYLWDGEKLLGAAPYDSSMVSVLILNDNQ